MSDDPRIAAERYRQARDGSPASESADDAEQAQRTDTARPTANRPVTARDRAAYVEIAIQQAIRRGDFDDLPGAGMPIPDLGTHHDPDWWIRRKIETERLTGLGPPALTLRVESAELEMTIDRFSRESEVREHLEDFNRRVVEARRQLLGGPPVVTPMRDVEAELLSWAQRRAARAAAEAASDPAPPKRRHRRRSRR